MSGNALSIISGIIAFVGYIPFNYAVIKRGYKPPKSSFIIWAVLDTIVLLGMLQEGEFNFLIAVTVLCVWPSVAVLMKYGSSGWTKVERNQLIGASIGIFVWQVSGEGLFAILIGCGLLIYGGWFAFEDAWKKPETYVGRDKTAARMSWSIFWLACVPQVIALGRPSVWTLAGATQPLTFLLIESVMLWLIFVRAPRELNRRSYLRFRVAPTFDRR